MDLGTLSNKIFRIYFKLPIKFANKLNYKLNREIISAFCNELEETNNLFTSILFRPKTAEMLHVADKKLMRNPMKIGIVIQGPPLLKDDFTFQSACIYQKMFDNVEIIISTWNDADPVFISKIKTINCHLILNKKPENSGRGNVNYQTISSSAGIQLAKKLGCKYVMKTRSDQRLYNYNSCNYLVDLLNMFPPINTRQSKRIVIVQGAAGNLFIPFYASDFFYFGDVDDMKLLFDIPLDKQHFKKRSAYTKEIKALACKYDISTVFHMKAPENYIMEAYAKNLGYEVEITVDSYWKFIKGSLIGISTEEIGLYWKKYSRTVTENVWTHHYEPTDSDEQLLSYNLTFTNWLSIYMGTIQYSPEYERYRKRRGLF